jgi:hypothetical protein
LRTKFGVNMDVQVNTNATRRLAADGVAIDHTWDLAATSAIWPTSTRAASSAFCSPCHDPQRTQSDKR